jgi:preprotein translocase subunit SecA
MVLAEELVENLVETHANKDHDTEQWDLGALRRGMTELFGIDPSVMEAVALEDMPPADMAEALYRVAVERYEEKEHIPGLDVSILRRVERDVMLQIVDAQWKDHLYSLDHLKEGIGLRGYGQRDPLVEYKKESFELFQAMKDRFDEEMVKYLWRIQPVIGGEEPPAVRQPVRRPPKVTLSGGAAASTTAGRQSVASAAASAPPRPARTGGDDAEVKTVRRDEPKIGRNDPCYCGSGKKYKKCHGA